MILLYTAASDLEIDAMDVSTTFLNADLEEKIYLNVKEKIFCQQINLRFKTESQKSEKKMLDEYLKSLGLTQSAYDKCLYHEEHIIMMVFVDDILVIGNHRYKIDQFKCKI